MVIEMELIFGCFDIIEVMCKCVGGVFVKLLDVCDIGNEELFIKFNELLVVLGDFGCVYNEFIVDGVLDCNESKRLKVKGYRVQLIIVEIIVVLEMLWGDGLVCGIGLLGVLIKCVE